MNASFHLPKIGLTADDALTINAILTHFGEFRSIYDRLTVRIARAEARFELGMVHEASLRGAVRVAYQVIEMPERFSDGLRINAARQSALPSGIRKIFGLTVSDRVFRFVSDETGFDLRDFLYFHYSGDCVDAALLGGSLFDVSLQLDDEPFLVLRAALPEASMSRLFGLMGGSVEELGLGPTNPPLVDVAMRLCTIDIPIKSATALEPGDLVMIGRFTQGFKHIVINGSATPLIVDDDGDARLDVES